MKGIQLANIPNGINSSSISTVAQPGPHAFSLVNNISNEAEILFPFLIDALQNADIDTSIYSSENDSSRHYFSGEAKINGLEYTVTNILTPPSSHTQYGELHVVIRPKDKESAAEKRNAHDSRIIITTAIDPWTHQQAWVVFNEISPKNHGFYIIDSAKNAQWFQYFNHLVLDKFWTAIKSEYKVSEDFDFELPPNFKAPSNLPPVRIPDSYPLPEV